MAAKMAAKSEVGCTSSSTDLVARSAGWKNARLFPHTIRQIHVYRSILEGSNALSNVLAVF